MTVHANTACKLCQALGRLLEMFAMDLEEMFHQQQDRIDVD